MNEMNERVYFVYQYVGFLKAFIYSLVRYLLWGGLLSCSSRSSATPLWVPGGCPHGLWLQETKGQGQMDTSAQLINSLAMALL